MDENLTNQLAELLEINEENKGSISFKKDENKYIITEHKINSNFFKLLNWAKDKNITLEFWWCTFSSNIILSNLSISTQLIFNDCIFEKPLIARHTTFEDKVEFVGCIFEKNVTFDSATFLGKVDFSISRFGNEARFIKTEFQAKTFNNQTYENSFREVQFNGNVTFDSAQFKGKVDFSISRFGNEARFIKTEFQAKTLDNQTYENSFREVQFNGNVTFDFAQFKGKVDFRGGYFKDSYFRGMNFSQDGDVFLESTFEGMKMIQCYFLKTTSFKKCTFRNALFQNEEDKEKTMFVEVSFKDCVFKETNTFGENIFANKPLFENCTFEGQFNMEHKYLQYSYEDIENKIANEGKEQINHPIWRDLFRRLKGNRLAYHNLIDASELRTQELYARELELEAKKPTLFSKDWIEKWQLRFYRLTSDHHTDLGKIFNNVIVLIALFGIFSLMIYRTNPDNVLYVGKFNSISPQVQSSFEIIKHNPSPIYILGKDDTKDKIFLFIQSLFDMGNFNSLSLVLLVGILLVANIFSRYKKFLLLIMFFLYTSYFCFDKFGELGAIFILNVNFIFAYLLILFSQQKARQIVTVISYGFAILMLIIKPTYLLPFIGKLFEKNIGVDFPAMQSLSVVYCILMFLMLFSLQKTARKNTIVPS